MMRNQITGLFLLLAVIGGVLIFQRDRAENISIQATSEDVSSSSVVTIGTKKFTVEKAVTESEKSQGLSNRTELPKETGMLFVFSPAELPSFWMKDMKFSLDILWIANNKIIGIERNVPMPLPGTDLAQLPLYTPPAAIDYALELNAGEAATLNVGDLFTLTTSTGA